MPPPVLNGLLRTVMAYEFAGGVETASNTIHFMNTPPGPWTQGEIDLLGTVFNTYLTATADRRSASSMATTLTMYDYSGAIPVVYEQVKNVAGTAAGQPMPLECSVVCSIRTGLPGRSRRGRIYFPHLTTTDLDVTNSLPAVSTAARADLATAVATLLVGTAANNGGVYSTVLNSFRNATLVIVDGDWDTQRRRGRLELPSNSVTVPPPA